MTMSQSIITKYLGPTNTLGSRIKAHTSYSRNSITLGYDHALNGRENHAAAAKTLATKLNLTMGMGWSGRWIEGGGDKGQGNIYVLDSGDSFTVKDLSQNANYKEEFCDFDNGEAFEKILNALSKYGWRDNSWNDNPMPCIINKSRNLIIWVDYKDPKKGEFAEERKAGSTKQFMFGTCYPGDYIEPSHHDDISALVKQVLAEN